MGEYCGDYGGTSKNREGPCHAWAGAGTDFDDGKCKFHRGTNADGSSHENNTFGMKHGVYADEHRFYSELDDLRRAIVDEIFEHYLEQAETMHGELPLGDEIEIFNLAVMHGKHLSLEDWIEDRPDSAETENPLVDREVIETENGTQITYKPSIVANLQLKLDRERRAKLKHFGLDKSAESEMQKGVSGMVEAWTDSASSRDEGE